MMFFCMKKVVSFVIVFLKKKKEDFLLLLDLMLINFEVFFQQVDVENEDEFVVIKMCVRCVLVYENKIWNECVL